ncbi:P-loop containing nucleoside triphosphate hydrolase protein [Podospora fimiseda]|uniref:P-loop containing nucleoside triphosphate hydrolase protein n=1 Tax=Podospora fimiseda TaxID=252190 RepID=A0AAN7BY72_9PEZI|nr:P-loop containing nucleoside triphosphate hydrolase protein [Podospora fimiseda]
MPCCGEAGTTLASPALLAKIDKLREKNIGKHVELPQLVVVGDQSSGKSSLLESLTGIPFPRDVELCTRYATQITQRRDDTSYVEISIMAGDNATEEHKRHVEAYHATALSAEELRSKFPEILKEVNARMGIKTLNTSANKQQLGGTVFSEDVLKIEICGPDADYLTVIDVPGIFRNPTEGVTTKEDMAMVKNMVTDYIKNSRTIILAVLPCNIDIANQEILTLAEEYDKKGERTLGILTKPDLLLEASTKATVCNIVENKKKQLKLGYYVIRSRGADQTDAEFEGREQMFLEDPWRRLPRARVGIRALKARLGELLGEMARREFPKLRKDVSDMLRKAEHMKDSLGPSRHDEKEQREYLSGIAREFQDLVRAGLEARYDNRAFGFESSAELRLITQVVNLADAFNREFDKKAPVRHFEHTDPDLDDEYNRDGDYDEEEDEHENYQDDSPEYESETSDAKVTAHRLRALSRDFDPDDFPELDGIIAQVYNFDDPEHGVMEWLTDLYIATRDIGITASDAVWTSAWREQSSKWSGVSNAFLSRVIVAVHRFITTAIERVCADVEVREGLWSELQEEMLDRYKQSVEILGYLVAVERDNKPYTLDRYFSKARQTARANRVADRLIELYVDEGKDPGKCSVTIQQVRNATESKSNIKEISERLHDDLKAYYDVAQKRFVDNVFNQAVGHHLLMGPNTPLRVFSQEWVLHLSAQQLEAIAGESPSVKEQRVMLDRTIKNLKEAKKILQY